MEAGKIKILQISIQHEFGKLFEKGYHNLGLMVVESNPNIAKAEICNNYSEIKISSYKPKQPSLLIIYFRTTTAESAAESSSFLVTTR